MENRILQLLRTLVSFRTVEGNRSSKQECIDYVASGFLAQAGRHMERGVVSDCPYVLMPHPDAKLIWFAHLDVVPAADHQFTIDIRGDRVYGRGAKDMKGAVVPFLIAFTDLLEAGKNPPVTVLFTTDEEIGGPTIPHLLRDKKLHAPVAFTPDAGHEPWIVVEHKAIAQARLTAKGTGGHGAMPWKTDNPVPRLAEAILALQKAFPPVDDWVMSVTPTMLEGARAWNVIPNQASCNLDIRITPKEAENPEAALDRLRAVLPPGCTVELARFAPPLSTPRDHPAVLTMQSIAQDVLGKPVELGRVHGGTDARHFEDVGIPAFLYGPEGDGLHGPNEWMSIPSLCAHVDINRRFLESF